MEKDSKKKYLIKNTLLFSIGNMGSKLINFLLVPLYTNLLTQGEYGTIDLIHVLAMVLVPIITINISEAVMRFSMDKRDNEEILSIGLIISGIAAIIAILLIPVFSIIDVTKNYSFLLALYIISLSSSTILLCYIRGIEKLLDYSIIGLIQTACIAIFNIVFLVIFKWGIKGFILAYIIAYFITVALTIIRGNIIKSIKRIKFNSILFKNMAKYSLLLIPNSLMWWIMNSLDRIMVTKIINIEANGIYAVSYKIPTIIITLTTIFNQAWMFSAVKEKDSSDKNEFTTDVFNALSVCAVTVACFLIVFIKPLFKVYVGADFYEGWKYTPILLIGTVFLTLSTFLSNEYTAHKDSAGFLKSSTIGAIFNLILNFILINKIGVMGAAIATCLSYMIVFAFRIVDTRKYVKIKFLSHKRIINYLILISVSIITFSKFWLINSILLLLLFINNYDLWKAVTGKFYLIIKRKKEKRDEQV